jgi:hypothetical protein
LSPYDPGHARATLYALAAAGQAALARLAADHPGLAQRCAAHRERLQRLADGLGGALARPAAGGGDRSGPALARGWAGPWNLRALRNAPVDALLAAYPDAYAWMTAVALAVDGHRDGTQVLAQAAASAQIELPLPAAAEFLQALLAHGWVSPAPPAGPIRPPTPASAP